MALTPSPSAAGSVVEPWIAGAFPLRLTLPAFGTANDRRFAPRQFRGRIAAAVVALCSDALEAATLASLAWLASLALTGFIHCATPHDGCRPSLSSSLLGSVDGEPHTHLGATRQAWK